MKTRCAIRVFCSAPPRTVTFWMVALIRANGAYVAGYELSGLHSYYDSDQQRQHLKMLLEALLRTLPELSMRLQMRFEIIEGVGRPLTAPGSTQPQSERSSSGSNPHGGLATQERRRVFSEHRLHAFSIGTLCGGRALGGGYFASGGIVLAGGLEPFDRQMHSAHSLGA